LGELLNSNSISRILFLSNRYSKNVPPAPPARRQNLLIERIRTLKQQTDTTNDLLLPADARLCPARDLLIVVVQVYYPARGSPSSFS